MLKRIKENKLAVAVTAAFLIFGCIWFVGITETTTTQEEAPNKREGTIEFDGSNLEERENGQIVWKVDAEKITMDQDAKHVFLNNVKGEFHDKDGKVLRLTAKKGVADLEKNVISVEGSVTAKHDDGSVLTGEKISFDSAKHLLKGEKPFRLKRKDATLSGDTFVCDISLEKLTVKGNAKLIKEQ